MQLQLLSNNNASAMFVKIIGIKSKYIMVFNPTPYSVRTPLCNVPTPYSQGDVARMRDKCYNIKYFIYFLSAIITRL